MKHPLWLLVLLLATFAAYADEIRPAYLELRQTTADTYNVLWKVPGRGDNQKLALKVDLPADTINVIEPHALMVDNAFIERWIVKRVGGLAGTSVGIDGLLNTSTDVLVRVERLDGTNQVTRLTASAPSFVVQAAPHALDVARTYLVLGVEHILTGFDHLLFVFGLLLIVGQRFKPLLKTITAFTVAHSITLALATLGFVHVPQAPVEAAIALSIMFVAAEILHARAGRPGLTARAPWVVAFTFGLLHGFGFAGALSAVGLPQNSVPLALLLFNVGVEIGQLLFVGVVVAVMNAFSRLRVTWPAWAQAIPPYAIGGCAALWVIRRVAAF
jgi:HupE / UreJ protein